MTKEIYPFLPYSFLPYSRAPTGASAIYDPRSTDSTEGFSKASIAHDPEALESLEKLAESWGASLGPRGRVRAEGANGFTA